MPSARFSLQARLLLDIPDPDPPPAAAAAATAGSNVKVAVRCRPFNAREQQLASPCCLQMSGADTIITNPINGQEKAFTFDYSYWSHDTNGATYASQQTVFDDLGRDVLENAWAGYNVCLFAYGQTGSGKSYSMVGYGAEEGIVPKAGADTRPLLGST